MIRVSLCFQIKNNKLIAIYRFTPYLKIVIMVKVKRISTIMPPRKTKSGSWHQRL